MKLEDLETWLTKEQVEGIRRRIRRERPELEGEELAAAIFQEAVRAGWIPEDDPAAANLPTLNPNEAAGGEAVIFDFGAEPETPSQPISTTPPETRYQLDRLLGSGGMGQVYRAYDQELGRIVAIKFLHSEHPGSVERFIREARTQAQVDHECVCKIYDVGVYEGKRFISMQYIEGGTLQQAAALPLEEKIRLMIDICWGLHAAHRVGLIHRDIKPANILVERTETGRLHPYLMDFGLAREVEEEGLTMTGMVVGTPAYMSPEQAAGEVHRIDRRSDVFSLGVTFYELLTGFLPFTGESPVEIMFKIMEDEPAPLRKIRPEIPTDVETIIMKCLEKDPARRYPSARALAEDLQRFLDGDPILARPPSLIYRWTKKVRKHRTLSAVILISMVLVLSTVAYAVTTRLRARRQAAYAEQFSREVNDIRVFMRYVAHMAPPHPLMRERRRARRRIRILEERIQQLGDLAQGPGWAALGQAYLALGQPETARDLLQRAYDSGYRTDTSLFALGRALLALYERSLSTLNTIGRPDKRKAYEENVVKPYRRDALKYLRLVRNLPPDENDYLQAMAAFLEDDMPRAVALARQVVQRSPWFYEALKLEGDAWVRLSVQRLRKGDLNASLAAMKNAEQAFRKALNFARSYGEAYEGLCDLYNMYMEYRRALNRSLEQLYQEGVEFCQRAITIDPRLKFTYLYLSDLHWRIAEHKLNQGGDPFPYLKKSIQAAEQIASIAPDPAYLYDNIGIAYGIMADYEAKHGRDPARYFEQAAAAYEKALASNPEFPSSLNNYGLALNGLADYKMSHGQPAETELQRAESLYLHALKIRRHFLTYLNLVQLYQSWSRYAEYTGSDPSPYILQAVTRAREAFQTFAKTSYAGQMMMEAFVMRIRHPEALSDRPGALLEEFRAFQQSLDPEVRDSPAVRFAYAKALAAMGKRPEFTRAQRRGFLSKARRILESLPDLDREPDQLLVAAGVFFELARLGADSALEKKARKALRRLLDINPTHAEGYLLLGDLEAAAARRRSGGSCAAFLHRAREAYQKAETLNPWLKNTIAARTFPACS